MCRFVCCVCARAFDGCRFLFFFFFVPTTTHTHTQINDSTAVFWIYFLVHKGVCKRVGDSGRARVSYICIRYLHITILRCTAFFLFSFFHIFFFFFVGSVFGEREAFCMPFILFIAQSFCCCCFFCLFGSRFWWAYIQCTLYRLYGLRQINLLFFFFAICRRFILREYYICYCVYACVRLYCANDDFENICTNL